MNVSLRMLRAFLAVARSRNFSRAAAELALTQPAISRNVLELEQALGVQLLHRTTREVELTDAGQLLQGSLSRVLDALDASLLEVRGLATQRLGRVSVASSPTLSAHLMPQCIARCRQESPGIDLQLLDRIQSDVLRSVRSGEVDFGVVIDPRQRDDLYCETVLVEPFCLVCPDTSPFAALTGVGWAELSGLPLVLLDHASGSRRLIDSAMLAHQAEMNVVQEVGHTTTIFCMVEQGLGLSVVPQLAVPVAWREAGAKSAGGGSARLYARPLLPQVRRSIMLVRRRQRQLSPVAQQVWELVARIAADMG